MLENAQNEENCDPPPTTFWVRVWFCLQINPSPFTVIAYSFYERNGFNGSSQRLLFKVSLSVFTILQHILEIFHLQSEGEDSASVFCCSVEEVEDQDGEKQKEEEKEREDGEDYQESAKHIKVIETDFKRPLRSSFRAKGGEKR